MQRPFRPWQFYRDGSILSAVHRTLPTAPVSRSQREGGNEARSIVQINRAFNLLAMASAVPCDVNAVRESRERRSNRYYSSTYVPDESPLEVPAATRNSWSVWDIFVLIGTNCH